MLWQEHLESTPRRTRISSWDIACGKVPKHWVFDEAMTKQANDAMYFCRERMAQQKAKNPQRRQPTELKVYTGYRSHRYVGKCYTRAGVICMTENRAPEKVLHTLAHEVAHLAYSAHGPRHAELTEKIYQYWEKLK